ncbi:hypothetical protein GGS23DRAFT_513288 [Durotheca rogersii]|uniref:uncharacterized protein n=1 Tax=Durotheca rogersii TaxID=419775 RepID=UPI002220D5D6|nr:uncharacterized protein GGS23DRAFT_513288 [Durotheca rogersii]KAI5863765.1 hypothetical protein GGS23DRAFT_513288 [Durotheca rogersii]
MLIITVLSLGLFPGSVTLALSGRAGIFGPGRPVSPRFGGLVFKGEGKPRFVCPNLRNVAGGQIRRGALKMNSSHHPRHAPEMPPRCPKPSPSRSLREDGVEILRAIVLTRPTGLTVLSRYFEPERDTLSQKRCHTCG